MIKKFILIGLIILILGIVLYLQGGIWNKPLVSEKDAREVALTSDCIKYGNLTSEVFYNKNSNTWWFGLNIKKTGCNPVCVVSEKTMSAEINWRCADLMAPEKSIHNK